MDKKWLLFMITTALHKKMKGEEILEELLSHDLNDEDFEIYIEIFFIFFKNTFFSINFEISA